MDPLRPERAAVTCVHMYAALASIGWFRARNRAMATLRRFSSIGSDAMRCSRAPRESRLPYLLTGMHKSPKEDVSQGFRAWRATTQHAAGRPYKQRRLCSGQQGCSPLSKEFCGRQL